MLPPFSGGSTDYQEKEIGMLKILVCVKQVPDMDLVKMDPETGNLVRKGVPTLLNPLDTNALEAAVRVKEQYGGEVSCISMGPPEAESALRECIASGADGGVLVSGRPFGGADTLSTSYTIVQASKMLGEFDLIFCGKESLDGATGQMGSQLAERFDASQISSCLLIEEIDMQKRTVRAKRQLENGVETVEASLPCLLTVEKANYPARIPNFKSKMKAKKAEIRVLTETGIDGLDMSLVGVPGSGTIVPEIYPPELPEPGQIIDEGSAEASAARLIDILLEKEAILPAGGRL